LRRRSIGAVRRGNRPRLEALEGRTLLASRLFALPTDNTGYIIELNPNNGQAVNRFAAPVAGDTSGENGLAFDGQTLYYMPYNNGARQLWELNPDNGAVLNVATINAGSGHFDGLGVVDGKVYLQDDVKHNLVVFDPSTQSVIGQLNVQANLIGGLTWADHPSELVATENFNTAVFIDPNSGAVMGRTPLPGQLIEGAAYVNGLFYFGSPQSGTGSPQGGEIYVTDRSGHLVNILYIAFPVSALAGDGEAPAQGTEQVVNGDFEVGSLQGWNTYNEPGSFGDGFSVYQNPQPFGTPIPSPPQGNFAAVNHPSGQSTNILYQDVTIPAGSTAHLSMLLTYVNQASGFATPATLDYQTYPNQQFRVDIVSPGANLLSTNPGDVLLNVYQTNAWNPTTLSPTEVDANLSAFAGQTVRLRIAVAANQYFFNAAVDDISILTQSIPPPPPTQQVVNGDFELGTLQGWTTYTEPVNSGPGFQVYSGADPFGSPFPAPPQGVYAAANNQTGPGTDILYQDVTIPAGSSAHLSMLVAYVNQFSGFATPATLDYHTVPNQQVRIDIINPNADLLSTSPGDVLLNVFQTHAGDRNTLDPTEVDADLSAFAGQTVRLRIAVVDNEFYLNAAVDDVSLLTQPTSPSPTPTPTWYYVADPESYGGGTGQIVRVDPTTGAQTVISSGGQFIDPYGVALAPDGSLIVADRGSFGGAGTIFRVDPTTGVQTVITSGGYLFDPSGVAFAPNGDILVADFVGRDIVRVDPATGQQSIVAQGGLFVGPFGITTTSDGTIFVADFGPFPGASGAVFRVDPATGAQTLISAGGQFVDPSGILVAPDGSLIVSDSNAIDGRGAIFRVDPQTGAQTVIAQDGYFQEPVGEAFAPDGSLIVADADAVDGNGAVIRVDLTTGVQTLVSSDGVFVNPLGVAVSPPAPPSSTPPPPSSGPTANAGGPYTVEEGGTVTLDPSGTTDPGQDLSKLTYLWDLNGDGIFGETGSAATNGDEVGIHPTFSAAGIPTQATWTVQLEVIDAQGHVSKSSAIIQIENLPPVVSLAQSSATVDAGSTLNVQGSFTDPGSGETYNGEVDYGDGAGIVGLPLNPDRTFDLSHVYELAVTYDVTVYVGDNHDGLGRATLEVTVNPIAPTFDSLAGASITYGQDSVTLGGHIGGAALMPSGSVDITLDGVTQPAAIDPTTGDFSSVFSTATLGVQGSPYTVTYSYAGDGTYTPMSDSTQVVSVSPRALTITAQDATKTYGDPDPAFSVDYSGFANGEDATVLSGLLGYTTSEPAGNAPVGDYSITPGGLSSPNYTITFAPGTLSVTLRALTITAGDASKTYGDPDPEFSASYDGLANGDNPGVLAGALGFTTSEPAGNAPVGVYSVTPGGVSSPNYLITFVPGSLTITPRALTVTADDASKTYGDPDPLFTPSYDGFATGEDATVLSGALGFTTTEPSGNAPVGIYTVTPGGLSSPNYTIKFVPGSLTITPRALTVTAADASKTYGDPDPAFTASYDGFADGDGLGVLSGTIGFTTNEPACNAPVGVYVITPGGLSSPNYVFTFTPGHLTVTPRALTIAANDASKIYGQPDPTFGAIGTGFAPGEGLNNLAGTLKFITSDPAPLTAPAGSYTITPSGLSSPNYTITFAPGTLTVSPATTTLTGASVPWLVVGTSSVTQSGSVGSNSVLPFGQAVTVAIVGASGTVATGLGTIGSDGQFTAIVNTSSLPVGSYTIQYAYPGDANFNGSGATGTLTVTYAVIPLYDPTKAKHAGSAYPIQIAIDDASGKNLSSPGLVVTAVSIVDSNGHMLTPSAKGNSNPGNVFRLSGSSYTYNLDTSGLAAGTYTLYITVGNDPVKHGLAFDVS
jgi:sugar lactone lactonase YvrE